MKLIANNAKRVNNIIVLLFGIFFCLHFYFSFSRVRDANFVDLRNRVIGTRLLSQGISPYFFKWDESHPETLYDPVDKRNIKNNMITSPPSVLFLMQPLASLDYNSICAWWVVIHYLFFLLILFPLYAVFRDPASRSVLLLASVLLLVSDHWQDSVFRGQNHFFLPAILAMMTWVISTGKRYRFVWAGGLFALLVWIRPNALLLAPFFLFCRQLNIKQLVAGVSTGGIVLVGLTFILHHQYYWVDFYLTCKEWIKNNTSGIAFINYGPKPYLEGKKMMLPGDPSGVIRQSEIVDIYHLTKNYFHTGINTIYLTISFGVAYIISLIIAWKKRFPSFSDALLTGILLYWFAEMTTPVLKMSYYYVELFFVVLLLTGRWKELIVTEKILLAGSFLFTFLGFVPMNLAIAELCTVGCLLLFLLRTIVFRPAHRSS